MSRISALMVALGLAAGGAGCAQCDTCDDFPAPCVGPNCGTAYGSGYAPAPVAYAAPVPMGTSTIGGPAATMAPATLGPVDSASPPPSLPSTPATNPGADLAPPVDSTSPPLPTEPPARPGF